MENNHRSNAEINCVADFIKEIQSLITGNSSDRTQFLYRGECKRYSNYCRPNIFRENVLSTNPLYEKSLFNTMRQNQLSNNTSYLENAIDAQHGEFPSRLLDVSYNCLTALYFAVTPYYHHDEDWYDGEDGMVYVFYIDEIFSPSAKNINDNYNAIIDKECDWFNKHAIFQKNHKFIDHTKLNNRIIAQQGAFILFQGNDDEKIPSYMLSGIVIPKAAKPTIRKELSLMFGINTGSIYPEIVNIAKELVIKSKSLITKPFCWENEIKYVLNNLRKELSYYTNHLYTLISNKDTKYYETIQTVEKLINSYRIGLIDFIKDSVDCIPQGITKEQQLQIADEFNSIIEETKNTLESDCNTKICPDLKIIIK